jgi:hypothetical protein
MHIQELTTACIIFCPLMSRNKKEYEVRSNLRNFTEEENAELYCVRYHVVQVS